MEWMLPLFTGLFSAGHCMGMCGGIVMAYSMGSTGTPLLPHLLYNAGRITSYTLLGGLLGTLGPRADLGGIAHFLFGMILLAYSVSALGLIRLQWLSQREQPMGLITRLGPLISETVRLRPLLLGIFSGLLPCTLLIAMQIKAMASGSSIAGMTTLALFGLGTTLPLLTLGLLTTHLTPTRRYRLLQVAGLLILIMAYQEFEKSWYLLHY